VTGEDTLELLPEIDREYLAAKGYVFDLIQSGGELHLIIRSFEFPPVYAPATADLLIIVPAGYPNAQLDMFWTYPDIKLVTGSWPAQTEHHETRGDRNWQRWSRHAQHPWRPGLDSLKTFMASVRKEIAKGI
jgi:hypothetical protein